MTIVQRSYPPPFLPSAAGDCHRAYHAQRGLAGLWIPSSQSSGRILPNLAGFGSNLIVTGLWRNTRGGIALYDQNGASFYKPFLPIAGREQPFSLWCRAIRSAAAEAEIMRQYVGAQPDRMVLAIGVTDRVRYSHYGDLLSTSLVNVGDLVSIGISEQPGEPVRLYLDGRLDAIGEISAGRCSTTNTLLGTAAEYYLLALAIWVGRALQPRDFLDLHHNPNLLQPVAGEPPSPTELAPPPGVEETYHRTIDMPNRPWWRRWSFRKRNY